MAVQRYPFELETPPDFVGFPEDTLAFLRELQANNNREWFATHKKRYEQHVRSPMLSLLSALAAHLATVDAAVEIEPKKAMYRIHRDVRFSADKSPYKTSVAASFTFRGRDRKTDPVLYFHISPEEVGVGGGLYQPSSDQLRRLRAAIDTEYEDLRRILGEKRFRKYYDGLLGETLRNVPRGYDKEHPAADLLQHKQYFAWTELPESSITTPEFTTLLVDRFTAVIPLLHFLFRHI